MPWSSSLTVSKVCLPKFSLILHIITLLYTGVFIARSGAKDVLVTKNMTPGISVYAEKRISVDVSSS